MKKISKLRLEDIPRIAHIHKLAFPQSALKAMGDESIRRYYHWLLTGPHNALFLGVWVNGQLEGFLFGGVFRGSLSGFIQRNKWYLIRQVLVRPWILFKFQDAIKMSLAILRAKFYRKASHSETSNVLTSIESLSFGILAIAVNPDQQGLGLGMMMMQETEQYAAENGFERMHLSVHAENTQAVNFYRKLGWTEWLSNGIWNEKMIKQL